MTPRPLLTALALLGLAAGCAASSPDPGPDASADPSAASGPAATRPSGEAAEPAPTGAGEGHGVGRAGEPDPVVPAFTARGPRPLADPAAAGIGREVPDLAFTDLAGAPGTLGGLLEGRRGLVVALTSLECPVTRAYGGRLDALARACAGQGLAFLAVAPAPQDDAEALRARAADLGWTFRIVRDPGHTLAAALGARRTADAFLLDGARRLRYRGAIDDQFGIGYRLTAPRREHLAEAVAALLAGEPVPVPATEAPGCLLGPPAPDR